MHQEGAECGLNVRYSCSLDFPGEAQRLKLRPKPSVSEGIRNFSGASLWKIFELLSGSEGHFSSLWYAEQLQTKKPGHCTNAASGHCSQLRSLRIDRQVVRINVTLETVGELLVYFSTVRLTVTLLTLWNLAMTLMAVRTVEFRVLGMVCL